MTCRPRLLKLLFLLSFILVACRQDKPTVTPPPSIPTPETTTDTASGHSSTLISDPNALPRPRVIGRTPTAGEELAAAGTIEIYFDQPMDPAQTEAAWQLRDAEGTVITGDVSFPEPRVLRFKPDTPLRTNAVYHAEIGDAAASTSGETLLEGLTLTFNTISDLAVTQTSPAAGLTDVSVNSTITVIFNRPVVPLLIAEEQADWPNPLELTPDVAGAGEWVNTSVYIFRPAAALPGKSTFTARVLAEVINNLNPNDSTLAEDYTWSFSTTAPTYQQFELVGGEINPDSYNRPLLLDQAFRIVFNQAMDRASTEAAVTLRPQAGGPSVDLLYTWDNPDEPVTLTFTPTQLLELNTIYQLTLATTAQSASGGNLRGGFTWSVRTIPAPAILSARFEQYQGFSIQFAGPVAFSSLQDKIQFDPPIDLEDGYYNEYRYGWYFYDLTPSTTYSVTILPGIRDPYGHEITEPYTTTFTTPAASPYAQFGFPYGLTLFREGGATELYVTHRNVSRLNVAFYPLTPEYATQLLNYTLRPCSYAPDAPLWQSSRPTTNLAENEVGYARFDLAETGTLPEPGFYFLTLEVPEVVNSSPCVRAQGNVVALVNANVTLKRTTTEALVWVTDLETGQPLADVPVTLYDEKQAVVASGTTDANGLVYWDDLALLPGYEGRYLALADDGNVFGLSLSNWGDGGYPYYFGINYDPYALTGQPTTYVYTERPLYRPGQPVSFKGIVRLNDDLAFSLPEFNTVQVTIASFNETIDTLELPLSPYGSFAGQIMLDNEATLGDYSITVRQGTREIGYGVFAVAEYRKPTFQVAVTAEAENVLVGETVRATVEASYFAGGALGNADVAWYVQASPFSFYPGGTLSRFSFNDLDRDTGYYFYNDGYQPVEIIAQGVSTTDAQGRFTIELPTDLLATGQGQQLTLEASVTDAAGNLVSGRATVIVHPAQQYAGIRPASQISTVDDPVTLEVALVDWAAAPVANGTVTVELFERRWSSVQEEDARGQLIWRTAVEEIPIDIIESVPVDEQGRGSVHFTVPNGGVYKALVSVRDDADNMQRASTYFWVAGDDYIPWRRSNDNNFELIADRDNYQPGDTAELLIASPFQGEATALVTVERGHIKQHEVIPLTNNSTLYRLPITGDMAPNVVVSVLIVKGSDEFNPIPDFKIGMVQLNVEREEQELTVTITPDKTEVGPGDSVTYTVEVTDHSGAPVEAELSLALSDLAALSLAPRRERPILDYFYSQRFLSVTTELLLNWLIDFYNQELPINDNQGGGDGKGIFTDLGVERVRQNFPDTAYWEGQLTTDSSGRATVTLTLPDNLTTWRMDVRAVTLDTKVGQATVDIVSSKPLRLQPQTPRFFVVGDQAQLGTLLVNTTDTDITATATLTGTGVTLLDATLQTVTVPAHGQIYVAWDVVVTSEERVDLIFRVEGDGYSDASTPPMATLPDGGLPVYRYEVSEVVGTSGQLSEAGAVVESIGLPVFPEWEISQAEVTVSVAPSLAAAMTDSLTYLEHFPYECTEQTISRFLPNVFTARALHEAGLSDPELEAHLEAQVELALQRLYSRQHGDGGWPWWEQGESHPLVTAYVVLGLVEARDAGYTVSAGVIDQGVTYLENHRNSVGLAQGQAKSNRQAFILYVLARAGTPLAGPMGTLYDDRETLSLYGQAFLAQAIYLMDAEDPRLETLAANFNSQAILSATGAHWEEEMNDYWNWNTDTRTTAIVLGAMAQIQPDSPLVANAARWLMAHRIEGRWQGTQETAWTLMGLTRFMVASGELEADYAYEVALNGTLLTSGEANADTLRQTTTLQVELADLFTDELNRLAIGRSAGGGNLYYTAFLQAAIPVPEVQPLDRGIIITRQYFRPDEPNTPITQVMQGETFLARLTIIVPNTLHYVMVEDYLPAGLEAVDTSLRTSQQVGQPEQYDGEDYWLKGWGWWVFDHVELRDEKVALSASLLPAGSYEYVHLVRAAAPGIYQVIPPTAWELYFPDVYGRGAGSLFTVEAAE